MMFLLDANSFIQSSNVYYPIDVFPSVWEKFEEFAKSGEIGTLKIVYDEVLRQEDAVSEWMKNRFPKSAIFDTDSESLQSYMLLQSHVRGLQSYQQHALQEFASQDNADPFLCSFAMSHLGVKIVTFEVPNGKNRDARSLLKKIKIPDICHMENIPVLYGVGSIADMFRELNVGI